MRHYSHRLFCVLFFISLFSSNSYGSPKGPYQDECWNILITGNTIHATCINYKKNWVKSELNNFQTCAGLIYVVDGFLTCVRGAKTAPAGPYQKSCREINVGENILTATCKTQCGFWQKSILKDYPSCKEPIDNVEGHLSCSRGSDTPPPGSYLATCRDVTINNNDLEATCKSRGSNWVKTILKDYKECCSDIINDAGELLCERNNTTEPKNLKAKDQSLR